MLWTIKDLYVQEMRCDAMGHLVIKLGMDGGATDTSVIYAIHGQVEIYVRPYKINNNFHNIRSWPLFGGKDFGGGTYILIQWTFQGPKY